MQVIGLCRFSYPGHGGFQVEHASIAERIDFLYAPQRLEERFRFLETFTLPSIRGQSDPDFTFLIVIGDSLPDHHRARLERLVADIPQAVIQSHPPGNHRDVMKAAVNSVRDAGTEACLQFRLDDDDAVAVSFIQKLRHVAGQVSGLLTDHRHVAIDFNRGYIARPHADGISATPIHKPYWTAGLAVMFRPNVPLSIMNFGHMKIGRKMPTVAFSDEDMMLRGHNDYNDSRQSEGIRIPRLSLLDREAELHFQTTYNIDADQVRRVFSAS
jgi:hypothetical protein